MKRFYREVRSEDGAVLLDGRPVRTPSRDRLILPSPALACAVADEWQAQADTIDPRSMPMTGLANAAIDHVVPDRERFLRPLVAYAETDLLCYRAEAPEPLIEEQAAAWDPLLDWARRRFDVHFLVTSGIVHVPQPAATIAGLGEALRARSAFALAAMSPLVTIGGSLVAALALSDHVLDADEAFDATHLDELWQARLWGEDAEALRHREARRADFLAAARFLSLL